MKYLMLIYGNEQVWNSVDADEFAKLVADVDAFNADLRDSGELVDAQGLVFHPRAVRVVDGAPVVTDGPYPETMEVLAGFTIVDCASYDRAVEIASKFVNPANPDEYVDVRPVIDGVEDLEV
jgi:hypothetical protein